MSQEPDRPSRTLTEGVERAPHRSLLRSLGFTDQDLERPLIGVVNSYSEIIPGHMSLNSLAQAVKAGVHRAGGNPVEVEIGRAHV